jgi:hypothetical protein
LRERVVAARNRLDEQHAQAVQVEDLLGYHQPAEQERELEADDRQHRQDRVLQRVPRENQLEPQSLGARGADVILAQHFEHRRAHHARAHCGVPVPDRQRWPDQLRQVLPGVHPERREYHRRNPLEHRQHDQDHQDAEPERGCREPRDREHAHRIVDPGVLLDRCEDAERNREQRRERACHERELQRQREAQLDFLADRSAGPHRNAEVEARKPAIQVTNCFHTGWSRPSLARSSFIKS